MTINSPIEHFELNYFYKITIIYEFILQTFVFYFLLLNIFLYWIWWCLRGYIVPTKFQFSFEQIYVFFFNLMKLQITSFRGLSLFHWFLAIFFIIFFLNYSSLVSYNVSITGHIIITLYLSMTFFLFFFIISFLNFRLYYLFYFYPKNVPILLVGLLILIELLSFIIRPFSLAIRLFANMLAGHTLLNIFSLFYLYIIKKIYFLVFVPLFLCFLIMCLEFGVAIIQAYVFFILLCIYLNDCYMLH